MQPKDAHALLIASLSHHDGLEAQSISRIVLNDVFQVTQRSEKALGKEDTEQLLEICERLKAGEPIQYITGWADFYGYKFRVNPHVLIPRMETESLIETCLEYLETEGSNEPKVLDIGTGSGCIAITIAKKFPRSRVFATDVSVDALKVALANATLSNVQVGFVHHDILKGGGLPLPGFDLIVSNPPYIPVKEKHLMQDQVIKHEPASALFVSNEEPLLFYTTIIDRGLTVLNLGGMLAFECNQYNAIEVLAYMQKCGYDDCKLIKDLAGDDRVVTGIRN